MQKRYERKFYFPASLFRHVEGFLRYHPAVFSAIYCARTVNNIYFDSHDYQSFYDHQEGHSPRSKFRLRWYGPLRGRASPVLEIKMKQGYCGTKLQYPLGELMMDENLSMEFIRERCGSAGLPLPVVERIKGLQFSLLNRYQRCYFLSDDKKFRITLDKDLEYYHLHPLRNQLGFCRADKEIAVLELKYDEESDSQAHQIIQHIPARLSRMSKYISGLEALSF